MLCNQMRIVVIRCSLKRSLSDVKRLDKGIKKKAYVVSACLEYRFVLQLPIKLAGKSDITSKNADLAEIRSSV